MKKFIKFLSAALTILGLSLVTTSCQPDSDDGDELVTLSSVDDLVLEKGTYNFFATTRYLEMFNENGDEYYQTLEGTLEVEEADNPEKAFFKDVIKKKYYVYVKKEDYEEAKQSNSESYDKDKWSSADSTMTCIYSYKLDWSDGNLQMFLANECGDDGVIKQSKNKKTIYIPGSELTSSCFEYTFTKK